MAVNEKDKYFTPDWLVEHTIKKAIEIIGKENITELVEPSAGDGAFIEALKRNFPDILQRYYDLYPEHPEVVKYDYKKVPLSYKKGRMTIGNPPFGTSSSLWKAFCKKAATNSDYIVFISPASQYNSNYYFKDGDLIYSELLNDVEYRGSEEHGGKNQKVRTCLNIYKVYDREGTEDWRLQRLEQDVLIHTIHKYTDERGILEQDWRDYEYFISGWGASIGEITKEPKYNISWGIKILNEERRKDIEKVLYSLKSKDLGKDGMGADYLKMNELKEQLIKHLYPTREERLEQDVEMVNVKKASKKNNDFICDFYIGSWGAGVVGKIYNDIRYEDQFGVKIHNEEKRKQIEEFFYSYREKYVLTGEQYAKSVGGAWLVLPFLKEQLIKHLYPTREERLEQDVLILKEDENPEYYMCSWGRLVV